jgi:Na+/proline symporter
MLACVMAAAMSSGDAVQITVAGLFSQNIYHVYFNPQASEDKLLRVTRFGGLVVAVTSCVVAILMRHSIVRTILDYFNILSVIGISVATGLIWRRMNTTGVFCSTIAAGVAFIITRYVLDWPRAATVGIPLALGLTAGVLGSVLSRPLSTRQIEDFFKRIYVPIGQEDKLELSLDEVVPPSRRLLTTGGLFIVKPSRVSAVGFAVTLGICIACVLVMWGLLRL